MELIDTNNRQMECCIKMDYNEAKLRLKDHFMIHNDGRPTPYLDEAARMAYEALEKQIPKKAKYKIVGNGWNDWAEGKCPACGVDIKNTPIYCPRCGHRIDWSEVE